MSRGSAPLVLGGEPRVDLMPAEVRVKRRGRGIRRLLALVLLLAVAAVAGGVVWATVRAATATAGLQLAQARTAELLNEQLQYAEVTQVIALTNKLEADRLAVTATEVHWREQLQPLLAVLPEGSVVTSLQGRYPALGEPELGVAGPLREPRAVEVNLQVFTTTVPQVTTWLRALAGTPAFADEMPSVVLLEGEGYLTTLSLNLGPDALAERFGPAPQPQGETTDTGTGADQ